MLSNFLSNILATEVSAEMVSPIGATIMALIIIGGIIVGGALLALSIYLLTLWIKALKTYIKSSEVRTQKVQVRKSLGETLKANREKCNMTQEFVAEAIGVSRQAVSKWETGTSDPSTANLLALAKLFGVSAEEMLKNVTSNLE